MSESELIPDWSDIPEEDAEPEDAEVAHEASPEEADEAGGEA